MRTGSLTLLLALLSGCQAAVTTGPPPAHADFIGKVTLSLTGPRDETIHVQADDCGHRRVRLRIGSRCSLSGAWVGEPTRHGTEPREEWRVGAISIDPAPACLIALADGQHVALRVDGGTATMGDEILHIHVSAAGSAQSFDFVGALAAGRGPSLCTP